MSVLVPMPEGVILHPRMVADWRYWFSFVSSHVRVRGVWYRPLASLRNAIRSVNHGTKHDGDEYRQCYRLMWLEARNA